MYADFAVKKVLRMCSAKPRDLVLSYNSGGGSEWPGVSAFNVEIGLPCEDTTFNFKSDL